MFVSGLASGPLPASFAFFTCSWGRRYGVFASSVSRLLRVREAAVSCLLLVESLVVIYYQVCAGGGGDKP